MLYRPALRNIADYLDSSTAKYPEDGEGLVQGIAVHDYIAKYVQMLLDGTIPYERMDRRVFRLIWEHKRAMLERIKLIENALSLDPSVSDAYAEVLREADHCRMLYAAHHLKRRDSVLPIIGARLISLKERKEELLESLLQKSEGSVGR